MVETIGGFNSGWFWTFCRCVGRKISSIVSFWNTSMANWCFVFVKVDLLDEERMSIDMQFSIQETTCRRDSGEDPATCDFQTGYYVVSVVGKATIPELTWGRCLSSPMTWSCFKVTLRAWPLSGLQPPWEALTVSTLCALGGGSVAQWLRIWALESVVLNDPGKLFNPCYPSSCSLKWK